MTGENHNEKKESHNEEKGIESPDLNDNHNDENNLHKENTPKNNSNKSAMLKKVGKELSGNYWAISTIVLAIVLLLFVLNPSSSPTGNVISEKEAGDIILDLVKMQVKDAEVISVEEENGLYKVILTIQGQEQPIHLTKDGKMLPMQVIPLETIQAQQQRPTAQTEAPAASSYTEKDLTKIKEFSQCLADNGVKAYGAGWCGYCKKLKETFGGEEQITSFYLECQNADRTPTEYAELCAKEQIGGFPTIKINGEASGLSALSSFEEFAQATGCNAPELEGGQATPAQQTQTAQQAPTTYNSEELSKISTFVGCLADKRVKIYGANWCGWTKKFIVDTIGGFDIAAPIYVECTENEAECSAAGVSNYPTTKINGEVYTGARDFAGLAQATGCQVPNVEVATASNAPAAAGCGV